jgi:hypothetical protein
MGRGNVDAESDAGALDDSARPKKLVSHSAEVRLRNAIDHLVKPTAFRRLDVIVQQKH